MGVRKAQEAATATAIRNGSADTPSRSDNVIAIGAMTTAVAALFMMSDSVMVTTMISTSTRTGPAPDASARMASAISAVAPVVCSAWPTGMSAPNSTMTGQSTLSYTSRNGTMLLATTATAAAANAIGSGISPELAAATAAPRKLSASQACPRWPSPMPRLASGNRPRRVMVMCMLSASPCSSSTSPDRKMTLCSRRRTGVPCRDTPSRLRP